MKQRVVTAMILIAIFVPVILYGGIAFDIAAIFFMMVGCYEILHLFQNDFTFSMKLPIYGLFLIGCFVGLFQMKLYVVVCSVLLTYLLYLNVFYPQIKLQYSGVIYIVFNLLVLTVSAIHNMYSISNLLIFYTLIGTYVTDTMALFCGKAFGKHKLNPRVSPKKTIEGSVGGYLISMIICLIYGRLCLDFLPASFIVVSSLLLPLLGQIGDLAFSAIKRAFSIKDYGNIFPGHGGVLDRIDSLTFNAMLMYCLMVIFL